MPISLLRFDMRVPDFSPVRREDYYAAALDMAAWADAQGLDGVTLSEHHATADGYLPAPLTMAAAMAARSQRLRITIAALLLPYHDPVKLAEELAVLDHLSRGRVICTLGAGYRPEEFAMFGIDGRRRGALMDEHLEVLLRAWRGESFEWRGRRVLVTPAPFTQPHPPLMLGGQSRAAARRAARFGLPYQPANDDGEMNALYRAECERRGHAPLLLPPGSGETIWVARDPERAWREFGRYLLHEAVTYANWQPPSQQSSVMHSRAGSVEELRAEGLFRIFTPAECVEHAQAAGAVILHPLCGGTPPELAWESLRLYAAEVLPQL
ncbi:MAG: LLM class flavin-dependent oxidoreductase [Deltaproteobacteria bacterium]|nr:LLM class flavin-dependent oxidoreductase [Deltaproteobacteria bacterium]